ncbi:phosphotransferase [Candidatus Gottesmanbacteria bacterium]|nr:phosphotransferase [Candidatus Gottesmanbacteria bacterium]
MRNLTKNTKYGFRQRIIKAVRSLKHKNYIKARFNSSQYTFIKQLSLNVSSKSHVGLYKDNRGRKVVIRTIDVNYRGIEYFQQLTEANILRWFSKHKLSIYGYKISLPKFYGIIVTDKQISLIREYVEGKPLEKFSKNEKIRILNTCLEYFNQCSKKLRKKDIVIFPDSNKIFTFFVLPFYLFKVIIRDSKLVPLLLNYLYIFYKYFFSWQVIKNNNTVVSHRDLHQKNILVSKNKIYIIDPEVCVIAPKETDLSIISKFYFNDIGTQKIIKFLSKHLKTKSQISNFIILSIFYSIYLMANESKKSVLYKQTRNYLFLFISEIKPEVKNFELSLKHMSLTKKFIRV